MTHLLRNLGITAATFGLVAAFSGQSFASTIVAPVTAVATSEFISASGKDFSIANTINQHGLSLPYINGVTDFDSYLASQPTHTSVADDNEWFSQDFSTSSQSLSSKKVIQNRTNGKTKGVLTQKDQNSGDFGSASGKRFVGEKNKRVKPPKNTSSSAATVISNPPVSAVSGNPLVSIVYGFSGLTNINGFALWNEEFAGIGTTQLLSSIDGINYTLLSTIKPEPSKFGYGGELVPYLAQVFSFDLTTMLFFKLLIYDCPGPPASVSSYRGCGIGEVAFSSVPRGPSDSPIVPVPAAFPLLASALGIFVWFGRRQAHT